MFYHFTMKKIIISALSVIALASCTVTENIAITEANITSSSFIYVEDFFLDVLLDFSEFLPEDDSSIMDNAIASFGGEIEKKPSIIEASTATLGENEYNIEFSFSDLEAFFSDFSLSAQSLITLSDSHFAFYLDINNYEELKEMVPFLGDSNFEVYGPEYNQGMSEEDYLEMISFLLGEEGPEAIENGLVTVNIEVPGTITATESAVKVNDSIASYSFPIISFLLLNEPLSFSIDWE